MRVLASSLRPAARRSAIIISLMSSLGKLFSPGKRRARRVVLNCSFVIKRNRRNKQQSTGSEACTQGQQLMLTHKTDVLVADVVHALGALPRGGHLEAGDSAKRTLSRNTGTGALYTCIYLPRVGYVASFSTTPLALWFPPGVWGLYY